VSIKLLIIYIFLVKFEENDPIIPNLVHFQFSDGGTYFLAEDILQYEIMCVKLLKYDLCQYTSYHFVKMFCSQGIIFEDELNLTKQNKDNREIRDNLKLSPSHQETRNTEYTTNITTISTNINISPTDRGPKIKFKYPLINIESVIKSCYDINDFILEGILIKHNYI